MGKSGKSGRRSLAEWVSFGVSLAIVFFVFVYLALETSMGTDPFVEIRADARLGEVRQVGGRFVLPVEVVNRGRQTVSELEVEVRYRSGAGTEGSRGAEERRDFQLQYLSQDSRRTAYLYFDEDPRGLRELRVSPTHYLVE